MNFAHKIVSSIAIMLVAACGNNNNPGVPEHAINPDVMKNPATASSSRNDVKLPEIKFEVETHDFGTIAEGQKVSYDFKFKNTGRGELVIRSASGSCGCTVPEWPKDPIPAGQGGVIKVTFDSQGKNGMQHKNVTIISNTVPNTTVININGEVIPANAKK